MNRYACLTLDVEADGFGKPSFLQSIYDAFKSLPVTAFLLDGVLPVIRGGGHRWEFGVHVHPVPGKVACARSDRRFAVESFRMVGHQYQLCDTGLLARWGVKNDASYALKYFPDSLGWLPSTNGVRRWVTSVWCDSPPGATRKLIQAISSYPVIIVAAHDSHPGAAFGLYTAWQSLKEQERTFVTIADLPDMEAQDD